DPGVEDAEVIVDLRDRPDRAPRVPPAGLLLDRDRRGQPLDLVDLRLGHLPEELPGVAGEALDVTSLPFGIKRGERQRALPRPADPREADQRRARQVEGHVAEVVLAGAADANVRRCHPWMILAPLGRPVGERSRCGDRRDHILYTCPYRL